MIISHTSKKYPKKRVSKNKLSHLRTRRVYIKDTTIHNDNANQERTICEASLLYIMALLKNTTSLCFVAVLMVMVAMPTILLPSCHALKEVS
jgi:hypothetical protein